MGTGRQYDEEFKKQAILLAKEVGNAAAAKELGIPKGTLGTWVNKAKVGEIDTGSIVNDKKIFTLFESDNHSFTVAD